MTNILDFKKPKGRLKYKVQWEGFGRNNTWYNADGKEFDNAKEMVEKFHRQ